MIQAFKVPLIYWQEEGVPSGTLDLEDQAPNKIERGPAPMKGKPTPDIEGSEDGLIYDLVEAVIDRTIGKCGKHVSIADWITGGKVTERQIESCINELGKLKSQLLDQGFDEAQVSGLDSTIGELEYIKDNLETYDERDDALEDARAMTSDAKQETINALADQENVRITQGPNPPEENCKIGPYSEMRNYCAQYDKQAHHIVPDYTLRYGTRLDAEYGHKRIPDMPSLQDGNTICLEGNGAGGETEHSLAHKYTDDAIRDLGNDPRNPIKGTVPLSYVKQFSIDGVSKVKPECADQIEAAVEEQFGDIDETRLLRSTKRTLPHDKALEALSPYAEDNNWDGD